jgi:hypothetical protein
MPGGTLSVRLNSSPWGWWLLRAASRAVPRTECRAKVGGRHGFVILRPPPSTWRTSRRLYALVHRIFVAFDV